MLEKAFTLEQVIKWASEITGKGVVSERDRLIDLIRESLDALYREESIDTLRKLCVPSCGCVVTIPKEISEVVKYRVGDKVGVTRNKTFEFQGYERKDCLDYRDDLRFQGESPIFFDLPKPSRVFARSLDVFDKSSEPYLLVQGYDENQQEIFSTNKNKDGELQTDVGERVYIAPPDESPNYTKRVFSKITGVRIVGAQLNIQFMWCNAVWGQPPTELGLLAFYDPGDEVPCFQRYQFSAATGCDCCYNVEILGHLRPPSLRYENEFIRGFDSNIIRSMLRANYYRDKNDINSATFNSNIAVAGIRKNNERRTKDTQTIEVFKPTSASKFPKVF